MIRRRPTWMWLLLLAGTGSLSGCLGHTQNPAYFPHLARTGDIIQTHAKPPGSHYYSNFDPHAIRLEVRPLDATNQVRTQQVLIATLYDEKNSPRRNRRVEWTIEGVGSIVEVDESGLFPGRGYKTSSKHAVSYTDYFEHRITRGNEAAKDDFVVRPGQSWCIITSPVEGDTHITVTAPGIYNREKGTVFRTMRWVDANWEFPQPAQARAGTSHVFTTKIFRHTDKQPLANYRVRYKILDGGPPAIFAPSNTREFVAISDLSGNAQVAISQLAPALGINRIEVEIIRPPDPTSPSGSGVSLAKAETTIEWLAPQVSLNITGPASAMLGSEVSYDSVVSNVGKVESKSMTITTPVPEGLQYVRSQPPAFVNGQNLEFAMGVLPPGQEHRVQATFKTLRQGQVTVCSIVQTEEGMRDEKCTTTNVNTAALKIGVTGPPTANLGAPINFNIVITNPGGGPLENALVTAVFSDGLEHESKARTLNLTVSPALAPQESRSLPLSLTATKVGNQTLQVMATAGNLSDQAQTTVMVQQPQASLNIEGPKVRYVGRPGEWTLVVANPSNVPLQNVVVRDKLPPELSFANADQGGQYQAGEVTWNLGQLQAGEKRILHFNAVCQNQAKAAVQTANVTAEPGIRADAQTAVEILPTPAGLKLEMKDVGDPVTVGKNITYVIKVTNAGLEPANGVEVKVVVPRELKVLGARGPTQEAINGNLITFGRLDGLQKDRPLEYTVEAQAVAPGDVRFRVELRAQSLDPREPVFEEESTKIVGGDTAPPPPAAPAPAAPMAPPGPAGAAPPLLVPPASTPPPPPPPPTSISAPPSNPQ